MTRLLLVRHGETDWNLKGRHQGQTDIPLNKLGRQQAEAAAKRLASESFKAIYASDLVRALETALTIAQHHDIAVIEDPRLREMSFGEWEGLTYDEIQQRQPMTPSEWNQTLLDIGAPGGESLRQFGARIQLAVDEILADHSGESVLIVAHGGTLTLMICQFLDHPLDKYWQFHLDQCSLSEMTVYPDGAVLNLLNDTSHLDDIPG